MSSNIFTSGNKLPTEFKEKVDTHSKIILRIIEREKDIENSLDLLNEKIELLDHNSLKKFKEINDDLNELREQVNDVKDEINELKDFNEKLKRQMEMFAMKNDITKLEKYIDLWNPIDFVTRDEVEDLKKEIIEKIIKIIEKNLK